MKKSLCSSVGLILCLCLLFVVVSLSPSQAETITYKFANYFPPPSAYSKICQDFIADLEKRSGGRIKVQYFPGGSLAKAPVMYKSIEMGVTDIGLSMAEYTPGRFPVTEVCGLPLGLPSGWVSNNVINDFYEEFRPKEWDDVKVLWMHASTPSVIISKKPVRSLEDLKGLIVRGPGRIGDTVHALGGTPAPTPTVEIYDALSKGVIDATDQSLETIKTFRFAEVAKYVTDSWQVGNCYPFYVAMNKRSYAKLPPDLKEIFDRLCGEYKGKFAVMWNMIDFDGWKFGKEQGVEMIELSPDQVEKWKASVAPVIENYVKEMVGKGFVEEEVRGWISFIKKRIDHWTQVQIASGIKSPIGPAEMRP